eukprot:6191909-Pleurochrysis_carterae.AAC.1
MRATSTARYAAHESRQTRKPRRVRANTATRGDIGSVAHTHRRSHSQSTRAPPPMRCAAARSSANRHQTRCACARHTSIASSHSLPTIISCAAAAAAVKAATCTAWRHSSRTHRRSDVRNAYEEASLIRTAAATRRRAARCHVHTAAPMAAPAALAPSGAVHAARVLESTSAASRHLDKQRARRRCRSNALAEASRRRAACAVTACTTQSAHARDAAVRAVAYSLGTFDVSAAARRHTRVARRSCASGAKRSSRAESNTSAHALIAPRPSVLAPLWTSTDIGVKTPPVPPPPLLQPHACPPLPPPPSLGVPPPVAPVNIGGCMAARSSAPRHPARRPLSKTRGRSCTVLTVDTVGTSTGREAEREGRSLHPHLPRAATLAASSPPPQRAQRRKPSAVIAHAQQESRACLSPVVTPGGAHAHGIGCEEPRRNNRTRHQLALHVNRCDMLHPRAPRCALLCPDPAEERSNVSHARKTVVCASRLQPRGLRARRETRAPSAKRAALPRPFAPERELIGRVRKCGHRTARARLRASLVHRRRHRPPAAHAPPPHGRACSYVRHARSGGGESSACVRVHTPALDARTQPFRVAALDRVVAHRADARARVRRHAPAEQRLLHCAAEELLDVPHVPAAPHGVNGKRPARNEER